MNQAWPVASQCHMLPLGGSASMVLCLFLLPSVVGWVWLKSGTGPKARSGAGLGPEGSASPKDLSQAHFLLESGGRRAAGRSLFLVVG